MFDEIYDRGYQHGRHELHAGMDRLVSAIAGGICTTFRAIQAIHFASPWEKAQRRAARDAGCA